MKYFLANINVCVYDKNSHYIYNTYTQHFCTGRMQYKVNFMWR